MMKWQDFLFEHAKFPFPNTVESISDSSDDISKLEIGLLEEEWKAKYAMRDVTLVEKLCQTLEKILGDTLIEDPQDTLLSMFGPRLGFTRLGQVERAKAKWSHNNSEAEVQKSGFSFMGEEPPLTLETESEAVGRRCS